MHRAGQLRSPRRHGLVTAGAAQAGVGHGWSRSDSDFFVSKMRIVLAREHADHPLLRRVSAHLDVERQIVAALLWSTCMKRLVAQWIINVHAHILMYLACIEHLTEAGCFCDFWRAIVNRAFPIDLAFIQK